MSEYTRHSRSGGRRAFSLIELLLAIFILGVGIISVAAVFPAGIIQQRRAQDDVLGPVVAEAALATLRSKLSHQDFGTFEEFGVFRDQLAGWAGQLTNADSTMNLLDVSTKFGDWPWIRPSMCVATDSSTGPNSLTPFGDIDVFSARFVRSSGENPGQGGNDWPSNSATTEFAAGGPLVGVYAGSDPGSFLYGVPFNRRRFGFTDGEVEPRVTFSQEDRCWPAGSGFERIYAPDGPFAEKPQYVWDCMFRRFQGRVQVAIFVYRVKTQNAAGPYRTTGDGERSASTPPLPCRVDLPLRGAFGGHEELRPQGDPDLGPSFVPQPLLDQGEIALSPVWAGWQAPGQWILDPWGRIHRVVQGRRTSEQETVRLARPIPRQAPSSAIVDPVLTGSADDWESRSSEVRSIWFIPPSTGSGVSLEPVYVTVREL